MASTIIFDGNAVSHRFHNTPALSVGGMEVQAIFGFIRAIHVVSKQYPGWDMLALWDGRAQFRYDLYPEYKANRATPDAKQQASRESLNKQRPFIKKGLQLLGVRQAMHSALEADDLAGYFAPRLAAAGNDVVLVTGDQDWLQLVGPRVQWYDPIRDRRVTHTNFFEETGYMTPEAFLQGKALMGDTSDGITGVPKIGEKKAAEILAQFETVDNFFVDVDHGGFTPKYVIHKNLASEEGRAIFRRNMQLMDLRNRSSMPPGDMNITKPAFSRQNFEFFCSKLAFRSILKDLDGFLQPIANGVKS